MIVITLNNEKRSTGADPGQRFSAALRSELRAWDVKEGCTTGHCGACTVLMDGKPVKSCLMVLGQAEGRSVVTLRGLADDPMAQRVQESFSRVGAVQCGFCTPGMVISATALIKAAEPGLSRHAIREGLVGNLCRCTGYHKIVSAVEEALYVNES